MAGPPPSGARVVDSQVLEQSVGRSSRAQSAPPARLWEVMILEAWFGPAAVKPGWRKLATGLDWSARQVQIVVQRGGRTMMKDDSRGNRCGQYLATSLRSVQQGEARSPFSRAIRGAEKVLPPTDKVAAKSATGKGHGRSAQVSTRDCRHSLAPDGAVAASRPNDSGPTSRYGDRDGRVAALRTPRREALGRLPVWCVRLLPGADEVTADRRLRHDRPEVAEAYRRVVLP